MDLFEQYEDMPSELRYICDKYIPLLDECSEDAYQVCAKFLEEVENIGYTFEYGLDGCPYGLQKAESKVKEASIDFEALNIELDKQKKPASDPSM